ncbi:hypothetical protein C8A05DRAFT_14970 [Staphylotrichum tortipilum]|uniref:Small ribosomal subunit protein uS11m n=1 Tax=Staphylotrichum tortipilum TaxID=2831512 RepID=A0AAN6MN87_9PEZI|nr:hypothetical protein C8A05DRAFT_14970 [Staphylotrichum longicolle]
MSRFAVSRLLAPGLARPLSTTLRTTTATPPWIRLFSQSSAAKATTLGTYDPATQGPRDAAMDTLAKLTNSGLVAPPAELPQAESEEDSDEPYHFHIYSHKHNTHITVTKPNRDAIISLSCGNLGFRKANRKNYDAAYQLGAYVINRLLQKGIVEKMHKIEVILRGFGAGREAVVKVLMGNEGKLLRPKIVRVSDSTRIKFGGTRSKKPRRLG